MRFTKTFLLHLYMDSDAPERICGDLRPLEDSERYSFKDFKELQELIRDFVKKALLSSCAAVEISTDTEIKHS